MGRIVIYVWNIIVFDRFSDNSGHDNGGVGPDGGVGLEQTVELGLTRRWSWVGPDGKVGLEQTVELGLSRR